SHAACPSSVGPLGRPLPRTPGSGGPRHGRRGMGGDSRVLPVVLGPFVHVRTAPRSAQPAPARRGPLRPAPPHVRLPAGDRVGPRRVRPNDPVRTAGTAAARPLRLLRPAPEAARTAQRGPQGAVPASRPVGRGST